MDCGGGCEAEGSAGDGVEEGVVGGGVLRSVVVSEIRSRRATNRRKMDGFMMFRYDSK